MTALIVGVVLVVVLMLLFAFSLCAAAGWGSESERERLHDGATMREQRAGRVAAVDEQIAEARGNGGAA